MNKTEDESDFPGLASFAPMSQECQVIWTDHCYSKPWSSHPDACNARPLRTLFVDRFPHPSVHKSRLPDIVDIIGVDEYGASNAGDDKTSLMLLPGFDNSSCEDSTYDWEEFLADVRSTWTPIQNRILAKIMRILQADQHARLAIKGVSQEGVQTRLLIDKASKRVRLCFGSVGWDMTLILWLHNLLLEHLRGNLLNFYLQVLTELKSKIPSLIDKLVQGTNASPSFTAESLQEMLSKHWDLVPASIDQHKYRKLPNNPLLLLVFSTPTSLLNPKTKRRHKFWHHKLSGMGKVMKVTPGDNLSNLRIASYIDCMITATKNKISQVKDNFPGRPVVLIGWHFGALVAMHVARAESVNGVVCLGFPTMGIHGHRGDVEDHIYSCKTPTLFVVGQHANCCCLDTLEDIRERLKVETGLVLVGGANDHLIMSQARKQSCAVTQTVVDRRVLDEMYQFLGSTLSQNLTQPNTQDDGSVVKKQRKRKLKDTFFENSIQPGEKSPKHPLKTIRALKLGGRGGLSLGRQWSMVGSSRVVKKISPKKSGSKDKKHHHHFDNPSGQETTAGEMARNLSSFREEAAIASAPELSQLLKSIKVSATQMPAFSGPCSSAPSLFCSAPPSSTCSSVLSSVSARAGLTGPDEASLSIVTGRSLAPNPSSYQTAHKPDDHFPEYTSSSAHSSPSVTSANHASKLLHAARSESHVSDPPQQPTLKQPATSLPSAGHASHSILYSRSPSPCAQSGMSDPSGFTPLLKSELSSTSSFKMSTDLSIDDGFVREATSKKSSLPETVSIDLGHIVTSNTNNAFKSSPFTHNSFSEQAPELVEPKTITQTSVPTSIFLPSSFPATQVLATSRLQTSSQLQASPKLQDATPPALLPPSPRLPSLPGSPSIVTNLPVPPGSQHSLLTTHQDSPSSKNQQLSLLSAQITSLTNLLASSASNLPLQSTIPHLPLASNLPTSLVIQLSSLSRSPLASTAALTQLPVSSISLLSSSAQPPLVSANQLSSSVSQSASATNRQSVSSPTLLAFANNLPRSSSLLPPSVHRLPVTIGTLLSTTTTPRLPTTTRLPIATSTHLPTSVSHLLSSASLLSSMKDHDPTRAGLSSSTIARLSGIHSSQNLLTAADFIRLALPRQLSESGGKRVGSLLAPCSIPWSTVQNTIRPGHTGTPLPPSLISTGSAESLQGLSKPTSTESTNKNDSSLEPSSRAVTATTFETKSSESQELGISAKGLINTNTATSGAENKLAESSAEAIKISDITTPEPLNNLSETDNSLKNANLEPNKIKTSINSISSVSLLPSTSAAGPEINSLIQQQTKANNSASVSSSPSVLSQVGSDAPTEATSQCSASGDRQLSTYDLESYEQTEKVPSSPSSPTQSTPQSGQTAAARSHKTVVATSYVATPRTVLSAVSATRTRKIKVPKQYDL